MASAAASEWKDKAEETRHVGVVRFAGKKIHPHGSQGPASELDLHLHELHSSRLQQPPGCQRQRPQVSYGLAQADLEGADRSRVHCVRMVRSDVARDGQRKRHGIDARACQTTTATAQRPDVTRAI